MLAWRSQRKETLEMGAHTQSTHLHMHEYTSISTQQVSAHEYSKIACGMAVPLTSKFLLLTIWQVTATREPALP